MKWVLTIPEMLIQPRRELLDDHRVGRQVEPHPPVLLGDRDPEQPELLHLLDDRLGEAVLVVVVLGVGDDLLVGELMDHLADRLLLVGPVLVGGRRRPCGGATYVTLCREDTGARLEGAKAVPLEASLGVSSIARQYRGAPDDAVVRRRGCRGSPPGSTGTSRARSCWPSGSARTRSPTACTTGRLHRVHLGSTPSAGRPRTRDWTGVRGGAGLRPGAALSHARRSALWGSARALAAPARGQSLTRPPRPGIVTHAPAPQPADIRDQHGIRVTSPARTLLDCAPSLDRQALTRAVNDGPAGTHAAPQPSSPTSSTASPTTPAAPCSSRSSRPTPAPPAPARGRLPGLLPSTRPPAPRCQRHASPATRSTPVRSRRLIVELDGWDFHTTATAFETDRDRDADTLAARLPDGPDHLGAHARAPGREAAPATILAERRRLAERVRRLRQPRAPSELDAGGSTASRAAPAARRRARGRPAR